METVILFLDLLEKMEPALDKRPVWELIFMNRRHKWFFLTVQRQGSRYYVTENIHQMGQVLLQVRKRSLPTIENVRGKLEKAEEWEELLRLAIVYLKNVEHNWLQQHKQLHRNFPYEYRSGRMDTRLAAIYCPAVSLPGRQGEMKYIKDFVSNVEKGEWQGSGQGLVKDLTAATYFNYCKIAYLNSLKKPDAKTRKLTGREMYRLFADGRDEGLSVIRQNSVQEFRDWMNGTHPKRTRNGRPWKILAGDKTRGISLYVKKNGSDDDNSYQLELAGDISSGALETVKIFMGMLRNGYRIKIRQPVQLRKQLLGQGSTAIVPQYIPLQRAAQLYDGQLNAAIHLHQAGRNKNIIIEIASWEELCCLKPRNR